MDGVLSDAGAVVLLGAGRDGLRLPLYREGGVEPSDARQEPPAQQDLVADDDQVQWRDRRRASQLPARLQDEPTRLRLQIERLRRADCD